MTDFNRRDFLKIGAAAGVGVALSPMLSGAGAQDGGQRPNVVIIYTDDQPKSQFGCYGGMETPNIDKIAKEGVRFEHFYVSTALCAPSRYGLHNGRYISSSPAILRMFPEGGTVSAVQQYGDEHNRPVEQFNLPFSMKAAGYKTGIVGKWHQGFMGERFRFGGDLNKAPITDPELLKGLKHNFDLTQQSAYAAGYDYAEAMYHDNVQPVNFPESVRFHNQEWVTWKAMEFMEQNKALPFYLEICPTLVHYPPEEDSLKADRRITALGLDENIPEDIQPSRESVLQRAAERGWKGSHDAGLIWLDDAIGALEQKLEALGLAENTILMVISDNGTGGKWTCYEGGVNTGAIIRWPGHIKADTVSEAWIQNVDIASTVFDLCGVKLAVEDNPMHGVSFAPVLTGESKGERDSVYLEIGYQRTVVRSDGMKYLTVRYPEDIQKDIDENGTEYDLRGRKTEGRKYAKTAPQNELFNILTDPHERKNLFDDPAYAETVKEMKALMTRYSTALPHTYGEFAE